MPPFQMKYWLRATAWSWVLAPTCSALVLLQVFTKRAREAEHWHWYTCGSLHGLQWKPIDGGSRLNKIFSLRKHPNNCSDKMTFVQKVSEKWTESFLCSLIFNPFPNKPLFLRVCSTSLSKRRGEKENLLLSSNFSFSHIVFYPFGELSAIFIKFEIVVCKVFHFGRV